MLSALRGPSDRVQRCITTYLHVSLPTSAWSTMRDDQEVDIHNVSRTPCSLCVDYHLSATVLINTRSPYAI